MHILIKDIRWDLLLEEFNLCNLYVSWHKDGPVMVFDEIKPYFRGKNHTQEHPVESLVYSWNCLQFRGRSNSGEKVFVYIKSSEICERSGNRLKIKNILERHPSSKELEISHSDWELEFLQITPLYPFLSDEKMAELEQQK